MQSASYINLLVWTVMLGLGVLIGILFFVINVWAWLLGRSAKRRGFDVDLKSKTVD